MRRVGTKCNDNFYFISFSSFSNLFLACNEAIMVFFNFLIFLLFFWNFLLCVGLERNGTMIFIFSLSQPFPTYCGWNEAIMVFFNLLNLFFLFFWYFVLRIGLERNGTIIFIFFRSHSFQPYFGFFWSHNSIL